MRHNMLVLCFFFLTFFAASFARSVQRPVEQDVPELKIQWDHENSKPLVIKDSHIEPYPLFSFSIDDFTADLLPLGKIPFKNKPSSAVVGTELAQLIEGLLKEVQKKKRRFTHFTVLQNKNFNRRKGCGLLVLKFKKYPFVLKLFIETPESFANPYCKGLEPMAFFFMAGGGNRHITGVTRIKNLKIVNKRIQELPQWRGTVDTPRKWFWLPKDNKLIRLTGTNIGGKKTMVSRLPGTYAIVADAIEKGKAVNLSRRERKRLAMNFCNDIDVFIDPHFDNFMFSKHTNREGFKMTIIDTEHFPTMLGIKKKKKFRSHSSWYMYLASKFLGDAYFRTKDARKKAQLTVHELAMPLTAKSPDGDA